jgi:hypothetical protein
MKKKTHTSNVELKEIVNCSNMQQQFLVIFQAGNIGAIYGSQHTNKP